MINIIEENRFSGPSTMDGESLLLKVSSTSLLLKPYLDTIVRQKLLKTITLQIAAQETEIKLH